MPHYTPTTKLEDKIDYTQRCGAVHPNNTDLKCCAIIPCASDWHIGVLWCGDKFKKFCWGLDAQAYYDNPLKFPFTPLGIDLMRIK